MKTLLKLEELAMFLAIAFLLWIWEFHWWWFLLLLIGPDISMLGYLVNNKVGAYCYNLFHHKGVAMLMIFVGMAIYQIDVSTYHLSNIISQIGLILFGHSSMDRFFGFGLKTEEGFKFTHLGKIGKDEEITK